jgi:hypothetical protein
MYVYRRYGYNIDDCSPGSRIISGVGAVLEGGSLIFYHKLLLKSAKIIGTQLIYRQKGSKYLNLI